MTTQISSPCITTTDICNGSYGCGTDTEMAVLARVVPVWEKDEWSNGKAYGPLSVVKAPGTDTLYISKVPVPCGIELGDPKYWSVYNDNKVASEAKEIAEEARAEAAGAVSAADAASRAVVAEAEARENADSAITTELNAKIMQEQEARETADTTINEEVSRLSSNSDALSARVDNLEQNGGGGIASLEARLTAAETINTQQGTEIESLQTQLSTANDDINSMGEQLHGMVEQVGTNSNNIIELRQDYAPTNQTANQALMGVDELRTSTATLESELRQLIVPNMDTQQFEKGPKMEEWTSGGGGSGGGGSWNKAVFNSSTISIRQEDATSTTPITTLFRGFGADLMIPTNSEIHLDGQLRVYSGPDKLTDVYLSASCIGSGNTSGTFYTPITFYAVNKTVIFNGVLRLNALENTFISFDVAITTKVLQYINGNIQTNVLSNTKSTFNALSIYWKEGYNA